MARTEIPITILNASSSGPLSGASISIVLRGTATPATVYDASTAGSVIPQPLTSDGFGRVNGWIDRGAYTATISHASITTFTEDFESSPSGDSGIDTAWISPLSISAAHLQTDAVTTAKIQAGAVTPAKLADTVTKTFTFSNVTSVSLGAVDGQNITGVRLTGSFLLASLSGAYQIVIKPNGLSSITAQNQASRSYFDGTNPGSDLLYGAVQSTFSGLTIFPDGWTTATNTVQTEGVLFTRFEGTGHRRIYLGHWINEDIQTNQNRVISARHWSRWEDWTTAITSLTIALVGTGNMTGRINMETIP